MNKAINETQASTPKSTEQVSNFVRATGRTRKAGYWLTGSGAAALLSAFLPWGSDGSGDTCTPRAPGSPWCLPSADFWRTSVSGSSRTGL